MGMAIVSEKVPLSQRLLATRTLSVGRHGDVCDNAVARARAALP
jgi:hypothetical protein